MRYQKHSLLGVLLAGALSLTANGAAAQEFKLTASASHPPVLPFIAAIKDFVVPEAAKRAEALGYSIKWTEAYAGALYNFQNTLEGIQDGLGDVGWVGTLWETNKMPLQNVTYFAPFATANTKTLTSVGISINENIPAAVEAWEKYNQVFLGIQVSDGYVLITKKPINSVEDIKGLKLYAPGGLARWLEGTGAIGVDGGLPVYYNGIKTGIADGGVVPGTGILPFKLQEVAPYITIVGFGGAIAGALTMNKTTYDGLPPDMQEMFKQIGREYSVLQEEGTASNRIKHFNILAESGATITTMPAAEQEKWSALIPDIAGEWAQQNEANGLPAELVLKAYMEGVRESGDTPLRDWDK